MNSEHSTSDRLSTDEQRQRDVIRRLVAQVAEAANNRQKQDAIHRRWADVNALRTPDRAPVWCRPVGCWKELIPDDSLECSDPWYRDLEMEFRKILFKEDVDDDSPLDPWYDVQAVIDVDPPNVWGVEIGRHKATSADGAWAYDPPLKEEEDFDRLAMPTYRLNLEASQEKLARYEGLFGDILPCRLVCDPGFDNATLGTAAADLRGLEQIMMDMIAEPELMHRLMTHLRDARMRLLDVYESSGLLIPNTHGPMLRSDPVGPAVSDGEYTLKNSWCAGNSQELDQVSPPMWEAFLLNYQKPIFERFAYACYGCCESLTTKIDGVLSIPNLRIFVCSAWTDLPTLLSRVGTDYCIMWRQKATDVVFVDTMEPIRRDMEEGMKQLQGHYYQVVLRELQTLSGHTDRLHEWTRTGKELAAKYA